MGLSMNRHQKAKSFLTIASLALVMSGCVSKADYEKLAAENAELKTEIEGHRNDEQGKGGQSNNSDQSDTGIWENTFYFDKFDKPTNNRLIRNKDFISGKFSNTATENSELNVRFLINSASNIAMSLYEYKGNNPVKASSFDSRIQYYVAYKDRDGKEHQLTAFNPGDRLIFSDTDAQQIHNSLLNGGDLQFWIEEKENPTTHYQFEIKNADGYSNAYAKLISK